MRTVHFGTIFVLAAATLAGCRSLPVASEPTAAPTPVLTTASKPTDAADNSVAAEAATNAEKPVWPASFSGIVPCADCDGLKYDLNLFADGVYFLRATYMGKHAGENGFDDVGRWTKGEDGKTIRVRGGLASPLKFLLLDDGSLRLLDDSGAPPTLAANTRLQRDVDFRELEPKIPLRGMFFRRDDGSRFQDCLTGRDLPVADDADYPALARAYDTAVKEPGLRILASVDGSIAQRLKSHGNGAMQEVLVVNRFRKIWPGEGCAPHYVDAAIEGTRWRLSLIGAQTVDPDAAPQTPAITLDKAAGKLQGSTGCNSIAAAYTLEGDSLSFTPAVITRMACPAPAMVQESAIVAMLGKVASVKVIGQQLELHGSDGALLARFDAVPVD
ncbi:MAG TPA: META domain-containing protein [Arenimonas sp.]|uniref:META domain-containing protein n=1 Tax=Arenimonas sp. TaxID=1872635 RepID=UPI002CEB668C|nr:META domain-containing protein [Arenimonas sp.]HMB56667.1 META domain-containing protein [Arenimonas sp.]